MTKWATRAAEHFSEKRRESTPITDESPHLGVLGVGVERYSANEERLLGVMGVPTPSLSKNVDSAELQAAAMLACDYFNDSEQKRERMRNELLEVPSEQWPGLIDHFQTEYGWKAEPSKSSQFAESTAAHFGKEY